jgi:hypothetical protein
LLTSEEKVGEVRGAVDTYRPAFTIAQGIPGDKELAVGKLSDKEDEGENGLEDENLQWCAFRAQIEYTACQ